MKRKNCTHEEKEKVFRSLPTVDQTYKDPRELKQRK